MDTSVNADQLAIGTWIARYEILGRLGSGSSGVVYAAYDAQLRRHVALKLLHARADGVEQTVSLQHRAQVIAQLAHPNIVAIHDVGVHEGRVFMAMEYVEGGTLDAWLRTGTRHPRSIVQMFVAAGRGLAVAHAAGIVHRDFKPANVLVGRDERVRVADFGLVQASDEVEHETLDLRDAELLVTARSHTGAVVGTPAYMAPEQLRGEPGDARADQFAFCVSLYEALYGERPFAGESVQALVGEVLDGHVRKPPRKQDVPRWLRRVVLRGLSRKPAERWPDMPTLIAALERGFGDRSQRIALALGLPFAAMLAILLIQSASRDACAEASAVIDTTWSTSAREHVIERLGEREGEVLAMRVDRWVQLWKGEQRGMCVEQMGYDERMQRRMCLARQHHQLGIFLALLDERGEHARGALEGFEQLDVPTSCEIGGRPLPRGEALRSEAETLAIVLDDPIVRLAVGDWAGAEAELDAIEHPIDEAKWRQLTGELALLRGRLHVARATHEAAELAFRDAIVDALAVGDEHLAAEAMLELAGLLESGARHGEALELLRMADSLASHLSDRRLAGEIALVRAGVLEQQGAFEAGLAAAERALEAWQPEPLPHIVQHLLAAHPELLDEAGPPGLASPELTQARHRAAMLLHRLGRMSEAQAQLDAARRGWGSAHAPEHPINRALLEAELLLAG